MILGGGVELRGGALSYLNVEVIVAPGVGACRFIAHTAVVIGSDLNVLVNVLEVLAAVVTEIVTVCVHTAERLAEALSARTECGLITACRLEGEVVGVLFKYGYKGGLHCGPVLTVGSCADSELVNLAVKLYLVAKDELNLPVSVRNSVGVLGESEVEGHACAVVDKEDTVLGIKHLYDSALNVVAGGGRELGAEVVSGEVGEKGVCRGSNLGGTALSVTVDVEILVNVTELFGFITGVGVTAGAGVGGVACYGTGGSSNDCLIAMYVEIGVFCAAYGALAFLEGVTESCNLVFGVAVTASAGVGGVACLGAGGGYYGLNVGVTESYNLVFSVGVTAGAGEGGVACLGAGRSYGFADVVMYVIFVNNGCFCVEGEVVFSGVTCGVGAPVVLGVVPLEVVASAHVLNKEGTVASVGESPGLVCAVLVERSIGICESENVAGERGEGVGTVCINGNNEDLGIGYVSEVICGVINALVVMGRNLNGRKKLAVSGCADKNKVTGLKLGYESPVIAGSGSNVLLTAMANAVDEVMAERLTNVGVAVHTESSLGTGCGSPYGVVLNGELFTALHTSAGVAAGEIPVVVALGIPGVGLFLTAEGTYCIVFTVGGTGRIDFLLHVPVVNLGVEDFYLFEAAAAVSAIYLLKTVGLGLAVSLSENLSFTPEAVSLGINGSYLGVVVIANRTLENGNAGGGTGSSLKLGMIDDVLFKLVLVVVFTALTLAVNEVVLVRGNVVGIGLTALTLAVYEAVLVRRNVVRIGRAALTLAVNEVVLVRRNVIRIGLTALTLAVNEVVLVRRNVVGISLAANGANAVFKGVAESRSFGYAALTGSGGGTGCFTEHVLVCVSTGKHFKNFVEAGNTRELLTGGEAHHKYCHDKHEKC